jgi:transcriptional regulator with XRE-family HTH domain
VRPADNRERFNHHVECPEVRGAAVDGGGREVAMADEMDANYARLVGDRLRRVRKQHRLSLQAVEISSGQEFKASVLGAYERGERAISVPRLQRLARFYNVPVDQLLPRDPDGSWTPAEAGAYQSQVSDGSRVTIDLVALHEQHGPEVELLSRYLRAIQVQRQDFNGRVMSVRDEDLFAMACLIDSQPDQMRRKLEELGLRA